MFQLVDFKTKQPVKPTNLIFTGKDSPWEVQLDLDHVRSLINLDYFRKSPPFLSKYLPLMPVKDYANFVSLGEGATPLIPSRQIGQELGLDLFFKLESQNPTGSFKDRGSAVELSVAREMKVKGITVASTGNMAASCSCYAAAAQIPCFVFVPEDTPASKLSQVIAYGGRIVQVKGGYNDAVVLAEAVAESLGFYLAGDYAFRTEGSKTAAFEIVDQLYFQVPDYVIVPIGCGTNLAGYMKGFREFQSLGFIDRLPHIIGVQASGAASVVQSFEKGSREITPVKNVQTIASAICIGDPLDGVKALEAIYSSNGSAVSVTDTEILESQYRLSRDEGLFVESAGAAPIAALTKLLQSKSFAGKRVVCILTGGGLKDPGPILRVAIKPPTIAPKIEEFLSLYERSFFEGKNVSFVEKSTVVFSKEPSVADVKKTLAQHFSTHYTDDQLEKIQQNIAKVLLKGKPVTFSDLQDTVQDALESIGTQTKRKFVVADWEVTTGLDRKSKSRVKITADAKTAEAEADGTGPVDAVINALKKACNDKIDFSLTGYRVHIRNQGTDAVVYVELKLVRKDDVSVGRGASPDIIQASIEAFEQAYNGFFVG